MKNRIQNDTKLVGNKNQFLTHLDQERSRVYILNHQDHIRNGHFGGKYHVNIISSGGSNMFYYNIIWYVSDKRSMDFDCILNYEDICFV